MEWPTRWLFSPWSGYFLSTTGYDSRPFFWIKLIDSLKEVCEHTIKIKEPRQIKSKLTRYCGEITFGL